MKRRVGIYLRVLTDEQTTENQWRELEARGLRPPQTRLERWQSPVAMRPRAGCRWLPRRRPVQARPIPPRICESGLDRQRPSGSRSAGLRPKAHPNSRIPCSKAVRRCCPSGSSAAKCVSTPTRRTRSLGCPRPVSGQETATPPSNDRNFPRRMWIAMRPSRAGRLMR